VGVELFHKDGQTDMTLVTFCNFANALKRGRQFCSRKVKTPTMSCSYI
jgi:hypothetical protein